MDPQHRTQLADPPALLRPDAAPASARRCSPACCNDDLRAARQRAAGCRACRTSPPKAKRVIYLFQSGAPSQIDLFDYKPQLAGSARRRSCPIRSARASG